MHEPYEARRREREEKRESAHYGWRSFVRALNENRTRFDVLPLSSSSWIRTRTKGSKDPCAAVTPRRNVRERIGHVCPTAFRHADPTRFLLTGFQALSRGLSVQIG